MTGQAAELQGACVQAVLMGLRLMKSRKRPFSILKDVTGAIKPVSAFMPCQLRLPAHPSLTCLTRDTAAMLFRAQLAAYVHIASSASPSQTLGSHSRLHQPWMGLMRQVRAWVNAM